MSDPIRPPDRETRVLERETSGSSLTGFALIKYSAMVIITLAILYFIAIYVLPDVFPMPAGGGNGDAMLHFFLG